MDETARTTANQASTTASQAKTTADAASSTASNAQTAATDAKNKAELALDGAYDITYATNVLTFTKNLLNSLWCIKGVIVYGCKQY